MISFDLAAGEMLPWGEDDCVLWSRFLDDVLPGERFVRAVAAQDVEGPDGELREYVWVGGYATNRVVKVDGRTGEPILFAEAPVNPYGFAIDAGGQLWVSGNYDTGFLGRVDTTRCLDSASCAEAVCQPSGPEGTECDGAMKARIPTPGILPYGITVDFDQRVWLGAYRTGIPGRTYYPHLGRFDPDAAPGTRWINVDLPSRGFDFDFVVNGIAADARGFVYGAAWSNGGILRIDAENPLDIVQIPGTLGTTNKGMAIDAEGKVWSITMDNQAVVVQPGATIGENTVTTGVATNIRGSYTYSDMTGLQLRLATNPRGYYRHLVEGCGEDGDIRTVWGELRFDAELPTGTSITFRVKSADTRGARRARLDPARGDAAGHLSARDRRRARRRRADAGPAAVGGGGAPSRTLEQPRGDHPTPAFLRPHVHLPAANRVIETEVTPRSQPQKFEPTGKNDSDEDLWLNEQSSLAGVDQS